MTIDLDSALDEILDAPAPPPSTDAVPSKPEPYIDAIPADDLFVDHTYQRELDEIRVLKMVANFDVALVGIVEVSARADGRYAILDGQHRWATVRDHAFEAARTPHIACRVHRGLNVADEAQLYHQLNTTRRALTGWDRWLARRGAGDEAVLAIEGVLAKHNLKVALRGGTDVFRATRTAEKIVDLGGLGLLDEVVHVVRATWPDDQSGMDGHLLHGVAHVLNTYSRDELDTARLVETMAGVLPRQLAARAAANRELHKGTLDRLTAHVVVERYNTVRGSRLEPFFTRVQPASKTKTQALKADEAYREAALAWAAGNPAWTGRSDRLSPALREAYDAHLAAQDDA